MGQFSIAKTFNKPYLFLLSGSVDKESEEASITTKNHQKLPLIEVKPSDLVLYNVDSNSMQAQIFFDREIKAVEFTAHVIMVEDVTGTVHIYCAKRFKPLVSLELGLK